VGSSEPARLAPRGHVWQFADCEFDELGRELRVSGRVVDVEAKPLEVLHQLLLHAGEVVTKDELLDAVWPGTTVVDGSLATAISKLRKAMADDERIIVTRPRIGYRLGVPVHSKAAPATAWPDLPLEPGQPVPGRDQWRLVRRLDRTASSDVWLAEHPKTHETRVFKFAPDAARMKRLKREVTLARLLRETLGERPDFVRVLEWNFDSQPYFVESEYCGSNLADWAEAEGGLGAVPLEVRLRLLTDAARAVAAAHDVDVLHKDLKPANILVAPGADGAPQIKIADFGSASLLAPARLDQLGITNLGFTQSGAGHTDTLTGTVMYVAPEVLAGQSPSPASDVYALGVLLYQLLIGDFRRPLAPGWEADIADPLLRDDIAEAACGDPSRRLAKASTLADRISGLEPRRAERQRRDQAERRAEHTERSVSLARVRRRWLAVGLAAVVAALGAGAAFSRRAATSSIGVPAATTITSLAVLPLANLSGDPAQDYLADGLTEALIADLSQIRALRVISRTSVMQYKGATKPMPQIARELHVDGVVEGSVVRDGDRVRITAQLIHAASDTHVWAETYDRDLRDILKLQRELAREVSRRIRVAVQPAEDQRLALSATVDPKAHELYLRGRFFWNRRTRDDLLKAVDYFQQATALDPSYSLAYAGLADAEIELVGFGNVLAAEGIPKAKAAAAKAIELDGSLAEPHTALAYAYAVDWDWTAADKEFQRGLALNPGYVIGLYQYGFFLSLIGRQDEAIRLVQQAVESDPLSAIVLYRAGRVYYHARQYDKALECFQRILELNPNDQLGIFGVGLVHEAKGEIREALPYLRREQLRGGYDVAAALAATGDAATARRLLAELMKRTRDQKRYLRPGWIAEVHARLGDKDEAFRWLERGFQERDAWLALLNVWPPFDALREDPRYADLIRRMNFQSSNTSLN
jgi:TolB-like protein/DNA-binding winged helix-turn-helix (wHTH) protein